MPAREAAHLAPSSAPWPATIELPGGRFTMGSLDGRPDERPVHRVWLSRFAIARLPVTNLEYAAFVAVGHQAPKFWDDERYSQPEQPVVGVPWADAARYCAWLSGVADRRFRLPTEAEWEYAALGGKAGLSYPWGNDVPMLGEVSLANVALDRPAAVGTGPVNGYGLGDMGWNVHEWCSDWYDAGFYAVSHEADPTGPSAGVRRSSRGGAWRHQIKISRCAARSSIPPELEYADYGFRIVEDVT